MWGYGILWIIFAVVTIGMKFPRIGFSMAWWGFTFPLGMFSDLVFCVLVFGGWEFGFCIGLFCWLGRTSFVEPVYRSFAFVLQPTFPPHSTPNLFISSQFFPSYFSSQLSSPVDTLPLRSRFSFPWKVTYVRNIRPPLQPTRPRTTTTILLHPRHNNNHLCHPPLDSRRIQNHGRGMEGQDLLCSMSCQCR